MVDLQRSDMCCCLTSQARRAGHNAPDSSTSSLINAVNAKQLTKANSGAWTSATTSGVVEDFCFELPCLGENIQRHQNHTLRSSFGAKIQAKECNMVRRMEPWLTPMRML